MFPLKGVSIKNRRFFVKALFQFCSWGKFIVAGVVDDIFIGDNRQVEHAGKFCLYFFFVSEFAAEQGDGRHCASPFGEY